VPDESATGRLVIDVLAYLVARLLLVAALSVVIFYGAHALGIDEFPLVLAVLFALVIALPLGIWVFSPLRKRATASIAAVDERRRADREQLRARLEGETPPD
jgi:ABC-type proline/glycine betaine transport system permease subunit